MPWESGSQQGQKAFRMLWEGRKDLIKMRDRLLSVWAWKPQVTVCRPWRAGVWAGGCYRPPWALVSVSRKLQKGYCQAKAARSQTDYIWACGWGQTHLVSIWEKEVHFLSKGLKPMIALTGTDTIIGTLGILVAMRFYYTEKINNDK